MGVMLSSYFIAENISELALALLHLGQVRTCHQLCCYYFYNDTINYATAPKIQLLYSAAFDVIWSRQEITYLVWGNKQTLKAFFYKANPKLIKETKTFQLVLNELIKANLKLFFNMSAFDTQSINYIAIFSS